MEKSSVQIIYKPFGKLSPRQTEEIFRLRQQVFIIEQTCFYEDIDGQDADAMHLLMYAGNELAAYSRIFQPGNKYEHECSVGRIVVAPVHRKTGLGPELIRESIRRCECDHIRIEAQSALMEYYRQFGFESEGKIYPVDGIDHIQMTLDRTL